jgi:hypothetical protein
MVSETDIWEAMTGSIISGEWWIKVEAIEWDGIIKVTVESPEGEFGSYIHKEFTLKQLLDVYNSMPPDARLHCSVYGESGIDEDIITMPDACSFDRLMQWACFGELAFD